MRIVIATGIFPPDIGGPALYTDKLARSFTERGDQVTVVTYGTAETLHFPYRVIFVSRRLPSPLRHVVFFFRMLTLVGSADWILCQDPVSVGVPGSLAAKVCGKDFTVRIPGDFSWESARNRNLVSDTIDEFQRRTSFTFRIRMLRWLQRLVCTSSSSIIVPSFYLQRLVRGWNISENKIRVVYNAAFDIAPCERASHDAVRILSVGRFVSWKGFIPLLRAFARAWQEEPRLELRLAGDGPLRTTLEHEAINCGIGSHVIFLGTLSHAAIEKELCSSDMLVLDTEYEGMSHVILEAMAAQTPVATTAIEANTELLTDGVNGVLVPPHDEDAWAKVFLERAHQPAAFERYALKAYETIQNNHTWDRHFQSLWQCIQMP